MGLGTLSGSSDSEAKGVSSDGASVTGSSGSLTFLWTATGGLMLVPTGAGFTKIKAFAISSDGTTIVGEGDDGVGTASFRYRNGSIERINDFPGSTQGRAFGVSGDGSVLVGDGLHNGVREAYRWSSGGTVGLGFLPGYTSSSVATSVTQDGLTVVGISSNSSQSQGFVWNNGVLSPLQNLSGGLGTGLAYAISPQGDIAVGLSDGKAVMWNVSTGTVSALADPHDIHAPSVAIATSTSGQTIVGSGTTSTGQEAMIFTGAQGMLRLKQVAIDAGFASQVLNWTLIEATGISPDGKVIVGNGQDPQGHREAFRLRLP